MATVLIKEDRTVVVSVRGRSADVDPQTALTAGERAALLAIWIKLRDAGKAQIIAALVAEQGEVNAS